MVRLNDNQIREMLETAKHFLEYDNIKFIAIDVEAYKQGKGCIDWSTHTNYEVM